MNAAPASPPGKNALSSNQRDVIMNIFQMTDTDGSGTIEKTELPNLMERVLGYRPLPVAVRDICVCNILNLG